MAECLGGDESTRKCYLIAFICMTTKARILSLSKYLPKSVLCHVPLIAMEKRSKEGFPGKCYIWKSFHPFESLTSFQKANNLCYQEKCCCDDTLANKLKSPSLYHFMKIICLVSVSISALPNISSWRQKLCPNKPKLSRQRKSFPSFRQTEKISSFSGIH